MYDRYGDQVYLSLMHQFTPFPRLEKWPEINRRVTRREYERLIDYALEKGVTNAFIQEGSVAKESFVPQWNGEGVHWRQENDVVATNGLITNDLSQYLA